MASLPFGLSLESYENGLGLSITFLKELVNGGWSGYSILHPLSLDPDGTWTL